MIGPDSLSDSAEKAYAAAAAEKADASLRSRHETTARAVTPAPTQLAAEPGPTSPRPSAKTPEETVMTDKIEKTADKAEHKTEHAADKAEHNVRKAAETVEHKTDKAAAKADEKTDKAAATVEHKAEKVEDKTHKAADKVEAKAEKAADKVEQEAPKAAAKVEHKTDKAAAKVEDKSDKAAAKVEHKTDKAAAKAVKAEKKTKKSAEEFSAKVQDKVKEAQARAKAAYDKNKDRLSDVGDFTKGNIEALREAGKILASGIKVLGKTYVEQTKANFGSMRADVQELRGVKSPGEFVKLQGSMVRKYFESAKASNSKQTKAMRNLANQAFQPISNRVSLARDKGKKAA